MTSRPAGYATIGFILFAKSYGAVDTFHTPIMTSVRQSGAISIRVGRWRVRSNSRHHPNYHKSSQHRTIAPERSHLEEHFDPLIKEWVGWYRL